MLFGLPTPAAVKQRDCCVLPITPIGTWCVPEAFVHAYPVMRSLAFIALQPRAVFRVSDGAR